MDRIIPRNALIFVISYLSSQIIWGVVLHRSLKLAAPFGWNLYFLVIWGAVWLVFVLLANLKAKKKEEQKSELIFLLIVSLSLLIICLLPAIKSLKVLEFSFINLSLILTSWQVRLVALAWTIGLLLSYYLNFKMSDKNNKWDYIYPLLIFALGWAAYSFMSISNHDSFGTAARDLGIFDQAIWNLSRFSAPESTIRGFANLWADHWHPLLALFAPLYWIWSDVRMILLAQALIISAGVFPLYYLSRRLNFSRLAAGCFAGGYILYGGLQHAVNFGFYPENMAPTLILFAIWFLWSKRYWCYWLFFALSLLCKENIALYFVPFSLILLIIKKDWKVAVTTLTISIAYFSLSMFVILPHFSGQSIYSYGQLYKEVGGGGFGLVKTVFTQPLFILKTLFNPDEKIDTFLSIYGSTAFLPFGSVWFFSTLPMILENFLSNRWLQWFFGYHYQAGIAGFLFFSALMTAQKMNRKFEKSKIIHFANAASIAVIVVSILMCITFDLPFWKLRQRPVNSIISDKEVVSSLNLIPKEAVVSAQDSLAPHLTHRAKIYHFPDLNDSEYLVLSEKYSSFPFQKEEIIAKIEDFKNDSQWKIVSENNKITIFKRNIGG